MGEQILWITVGAVAAVSVLVAAVRSKKPVRQIAAGAVQGLCALAAVNVAGTFTGISLGIGWLSLTAAGLLGIPGVTTLLLLQWICR